MLFCRYGMFLEYPSSGIARSLKIGKPNDLNLWEPNTFTGSGVLHVVYEKLKMKQL